MKIIQDTYYLEKIEKLQKELQEILNKTKNPTRESRHLSIANQELINLQSFLRDKNDKDIQYKRNSK